MPDIEHPPVQPLNHPDAFYLTSASGWLDLGNASEAEAELRQIAPEHRFHPQVLQAKWEIYAATQRWQEAADAARSIEQVIPEHADGWIKHAYALHELKRTKEAWDTLHPVLGNFPKEHIIPYNLSCYACQMGNLAEALDLLKHAIRVGGKSKVRKMALQDADLQPLKAVIEKL